MKTSLAQKVLRLSLSFISLYQSIRGKRIINNPVVLCYHNVGYDTWNFTISPKSLTEQLTWVKQSARVVPVSQIQKYQKKKESVVAVSFDDGYRSMLTRADAIVKKLEIQPMLFILGNPKKANRVQLDNKLPLLTISEMRKLIKKNWEIGYHTNTHADLSTLSAAELYIEVISSKEIIENQLSIKIDYFAYPRGIYDEKVNRLMKRTPYKLAFTVDGGSVNGSPDSKHIQRVCFEGKLELHQFQALMSKPGLLFYRAFMKALKIKEKQTRRIRNWRTLFKKQTFSKIKLSKLDLKINL